MWDAKKRRQFEQLREKEGNGTLSAAERARLTAMIEEIEIAEAAYLGPAIQRLEGECAQVEAQNAALQGLIQRKQEMIRRLEQILAETKAEEDAIQEELRRVLSGSAPAPS
jgi:chromosome segregation ATPase